MGYLGMDGIVYALIDPTTLLIRYTSRKRKPGTSVCSCSVSRDVARDVREAVRDLDGLDDRQGLGFLGNYAEM